MRIIFVYLLLPTFAVAQGVRSSCPEGECLGGDISPYFYLFIFLLIAAIALYRILKGTESQRKWGKRFYEMVIKLTILFVFLPIFIGFLLGAYAGILGFFGIMIYFCFTEGLSKWAVGEDSEWR